jgi:hypothetical protein
MNRLHALTGHRLLPQVFLIERDAGLLCRILGLYAARSLEVWQVEYASDAPDWMTLRVQVGCAAEDWQATSESLRVLVAKASSFVGVMAVEEQASHGVPHDDGLTAP